MTIQHSLLPRSTQRKVQSAFLGSEQNDDWKWWTIDLGIYQPRYLIGAAWLPCDNCSQRCCHVRGLGKDANCLCTPKCMKIKLINQNLTCPMNINRIENIIEKWLAATIASLLGVQAHTKSGLDKLTKWAAFHVQFAGQYDLQWERRLLGSPSQMQQELPQIWWKNCWKGDWKQRAKW